MKDDSEFKENLRTLALDAAEYVSYFGELGITHIEDFGAQAILNREQKDVTSSAANDHGNPRINSAALERHVRAEAQVSKQINKSISNDKTTTTSNEAQEVNSQIIMPKRTTTKQGAPQEALPESPPPPPQETLFGEITPQDEASLPRADETLEDIWRDITPQCMRCPLCCQGRTQVVNSEGNREARLMFVGEAPGADEDAQGRPFVGRAGQLLNKIIEAIGLRRADVFIGNVNRCRPPQNRTPTPAEAKICKPFLLREIAVVRPEVIVVLGNTAMKNLLDTKEGITKLRGNFQDYNGIKVMPTFHPAYLLRDPTKKRETWEDMKKVREYLKTVVSNG
jgi:uracil-DNA glycosylase